MEAGLCLAVVANVAKLLWNQQNLYCVVCSFTADYYTTALLVIGGRISLLRPRRFVAEKVFEEICYMPSHGMHFRLAHQVLDHSAALIASLFRIDRASLWGEIGPSGQVSALPCSSSTGTGAAPLSLFFVVHSLQSHSAGLPRVKSKANKSLLQTTTYCVGQYVLHRKWTKLLENFPFGSRRVLDVFADTDDQYRISTISELRVEESTLNHCFKGVNWELTTPKIGELTLFEIKMWWYKILSCICEPCTHVKTTWFGRKFWLKEL